MEPNLQKGMQVMDSFIGRYGSFKSPGIVRLLCQPKCESNTASDGNLQVIHRINFIFTFLYKRLLTHMVGQK